MRAVRAPSVDQLTNVSQTCFIVALSATSTGFSAKRACAFSAPGVVDFSSAIALGTELVPGDYVLQISIIDNLAKAKRNTASQFVQFEVLE